jgi:hypothetical protein
MTDSPPSQPPTVSEQSEDGDQLSPTPHDFAYNQLSAFSSSSGDIDDQVIPTINAHTRQLRSLRYRVNELEIMMGVVLMLIMAFLIWKLISFLLRR